MKAWRKHNMEQAEVIKSAERRITRLQHTLTFLNLRDRSYYQDRITKEEEKINAAENYKLRTKHERRTHFAAEVATPSQNLYLIMAHAGLPVPEEFMSQIVMAAQKQNAARSTASNPST